MWNEWPHWPQGHQKAKVTQQRGHFPARKRRQQQHKDPARLQETRGVKKITVYCKWSSSLFINTASKSHYSPKGRLFSPWWIGCSLLCPGQRERLSPLLSWLRHQHCNKSVPITALSLFSPHPPWRGTNDTVSNGERPPARPSSDRSQVAQQRGSVRKGRWLGAF